MKPKPETINLPHGERFREAWEMWVDDRRERKKPLTESAIKIQLKKLSAVTEDDAVQMIEMSINRGWLGIFPLNEFHKEQKPKIWL